MKRILFLTALLLCIPFSIAAQTPGGTTPIRWVSALPTKCETNKRQRVLLYKYTATAGIYYCSAANTWTLATSAVSVLAGGSAGTAAAPTFSFSTDPDTGMFSSGANALGFSTGGTERGTLSSAGLFTTTGGVTTTTVTTSGGVELGNASDTTLARSAAGTATIEGHQVVVNDGIVLDRTVTAGGTTGAQAINKAAGTVNFAAAATSVVVTNSLVSATSIIFTTIRTADTTCTFVKSVVPGSGSFTITVNAGCAAETSIGFLVTN